MAWASTPTILSLDEYAVWLGVAPPHFNQAQIPLSDEVFPLTARCSDVWFQYDWQGRDRVSREELARAIAAAEQEIADQVGYYPAPAFIKEETHPYPQNWKRQWNGGLQNNGLFPAIKTRYGYIQQTGQRAVTLAATATTAGGELVYSDDDGDGFAETATVTVSTSVTDICELKVYFAGENGEPNWEIRPARSKTLSGGTFTAVFDSWLFIKPSLLKQYPTTSDETPIVDISGTGNYVTSVEVYREYVDTTQESAKFYWQPSSSAGLCETCNGTGCTACQLTTQTGCAHIRDARLGLVTPTPAAYDSDSGAWSFSSWTLNRFPSLVEIWYRAGFIHRDNDNCFALSNFWKEVICMLATARLVKPVCGCVSERAAYWQEDLSRSGEVSYQLNFEMLDNPFGVRRGEVEAWRRIYRTRKRQFTGAAI